MSSPPGRAQCCAPRCREPLVETAWPSWGRMLTALPDYFASGLCATAISAAPLVEQVALRLGGEDFVLARLGGSGLIDRIVTTDSHPHARGSAGSFITVESVAPLLAALLDRSADRAPPSPGHGRG